MFGGKKDDLIVLEHQKMLKNNETIHIYENPQYEK